MSKIVTVSSSGILPTKAWSVLGADYIFTVLKDDSDNFLLELPPNCGVHTNSSEVPAYWVYKTYCLPAYKQGQRWKYKESMIVELGEDKPTNAVVTQAMAYTGYDIGSVIKTTIETFPEYWTYLWGQDKPV